MFQRLGSPTETENEITASSQQSVPFCGRGKKKEKLPKPVEDVHIDFRPVQPGDTKRCGSCGNPHCERLLPAWALKKEKEKKTKLHPCHQSSIPPRTCGNASMRSLLWLERKKKREREIKEEICDFVAEIFHPKSTYLLTLRVGFVSSRVRRNQVRKSRGLADEVSRRS